ncbi:3945_t:CDS:2 [Funneliformis geosporum]|uniref:9203_t:CDS:1 n=1 Tax=Funneliformis geosporum TaxID=1117311 RepID=A0A9W4SED1_9GLOM|nr:3945_t:CDS:2 [Funneliformis geosporum]CAI2165980.1 9203_t:CDS:2 [Funneliformis geosporum]
MVETPSAAIPFGNPIKLIDTFQFCTTFNPQTLEWNIAKTKGEVPTRRRDIEAVIDN